MQGNFNQLLDHASNKENLRLNNREVKSRAQVDKESIQKEVFDRCLIVIQNLRKQEVNKFHEKLQVCRDKVGLEKLNRENSRSPNTTTRLLPFNHRTNLS